MLMAAVLLAGELVLNSLVLGEEWRQLAQDSGAAPPSIPILIAAYATIVPLSALLLWLYLTLRSSFGPGPTSALLAGAVLAGVFWGARDGRFVAGGIRHIQDRLGHHAVGRAAATLCRLPGRCIL